MTRVAFICLGAYHIAAWNKEQNFDRQSVYSIALNQALSIAEHPATKEKELDLSLYIMENTVSNPEEQVIKELRDQFTHPRIKDVMYINDNSLGAKNKGAGEYMMCRAVIEKHKEELKNYDWIVYYTLRQIIVQANTLQAIHEIEMSADKKENVIIGGLDSFDKTGRKTIAVKENYCDMIFAMKPTQFFDYIDSMSPEELTKKKMNSEKNLYFFVKRGVENGIIYEKELPWNGVMRYVQPTNTTEIC
jgi:hypothetical protein